jgi:hypothetical protein
MREIAEAQDRPVARVYRAAFEQSALRQSKLGLQHNDDKAEESKIAPKTVIVAHSPRIPEWIVDPGLIWKIARLSTKEQMQIAQTLGKTELNVAQQQQLAARLVAFKTSRQ